MRIVVWQTNHRKENSKFAIYTNHLQFIDEIMLRVFVLILALTFSESKPSEEALKILCAACEAAVPALKALLEAEASIETFLMSSCGLLESHAEQCKNSVPDFVKLFKEGLPDSSTELICKRFEMCP
ncbi:hypothetical protein CRM22_001935 [Opisthorchis felineus]|uniref:Saposin B-type domain-containing protein n=1 Tax=Opisthorchis felineus TaxID=147828 RepID=A0A4S2M8N6_OPIFE|nr:hypothetical protein CRM22_001935 [Opisthorchis felineus]